MNLSQELCNRAAVIALIVGLAAPRIIDSFGRAKSKTATIQMSNVKAVLQLYYIDVGRFPTEAEGLVGERFDEDAGLQYPDCAVG